MAAPLPHLILPCSRLTADSQLTLRLEHLHSLSPALRVQIVRAPSRYVDAIEKVEGLRKSAATYDEAALLVTAYEAEEAVLVGLREGTVQSRLGDLLKENHIKVRGQSYYRGHSSHSSHTVVAHCIVTSLLAPNGRVRRVRVWLCAW